MGQSSSSSGFGGSDGGSSGGGSSSSGGGGGPSPGGPSAPSSTSGGGPKPGPKGGPPSPSPKHISNEPSSQEQFSFSFILLVCGSSNSTFNGLFPKVKSVPGPRFPALCLIMNAEYTRALSKYIFTFSLV